MNKYQSKHGGNSGRSPFRGKPSSPRPYSSRNSDSPRQEGNFNPKARWARPAAPGARPFGGAGKFGQARDSYQSRDSRPQREGEGAPVRFGGKPSFARPARSDSRPFAKPFTPREGGFAPRPFQGGARAPFRPQGGTPSRDRETSRPFAPRTPRPFSGADDRYETRPFTPRGNRNDKPSFHRGDATRFDGFNRGYKRGGEEKKEFAPTRPRTTTRASYTPKKIENGTEGAPTSWGGVAQWYDEHLKTDNTYHQKVILPNVLRLVDPKKDETILDLACGQGFFARAFHEKGATVIGVEIGEELVKLARQESAGITYHVGSAEELTMIPDHSIDKINITLAIQNIAKVGAVCTEAARVLKLGGAFHIVMNHPAFRIPKRSTWGYDDKAGVQFRRIDSYVAESKEAIEMHPGMQNSPTTISFHRPLQYYFKALAKAGFAVDRLEEWTSHKVSDSGPRAKAENLARKEIPLFLYLRAVVQ